MPIRTVCPKCQAVYQMADQHGGKQLRCKRCQTVFTIAEASSPPMAIRGEADMPPPAPSRPSSVTTRRDPSVRSTRDEEDVKVEPRSKKGGSALPWILGCGIIGFGALIFLGGGGVLLTYFLFSAPTTNPGYTSAPAPAPAIAPQPKLEQPLNQPAAGNPPIQGQPGLEPAKPEPKKDIKPPKAVAEAPRNPPQTSDGRLNAKTLERLKQATVYLRVTMADGAKASGSGFFGCKESPNILLTNAHVVGMLSPDGVPPRLVEAVVNSGQRGEWTTPARVLGVDRFSDLAVLDIGKPSRPTPEPLTVKSAGELKELDKLYVLGFPFGEQLGKEITIAETSVSSLRRKSGSLDRVQVNGGMNPGNSGGPLVDPSGTVVGVAVSGIPGRQINFAIPGERVHIILNGRISGMSYHQPYFGDGDKIIVPAVMDMIDPRNLIKEVGVDIWVANKPANAGLGHRPPATAQPPARPGDSVHAYFPLKYQTTKGTGDILLPDLPPGKVYWHQPRWINASGEAHWASANLLRLPTQPVHRKPANLVLRYPQGVKRPLDLFIENTFKVSNDDDADTFRVRTRASFSEIVEQAGANGSRLKLIYRLPVPTRDLVLPGNKIRPSRLLEQLKNDLPRLITSVQIDRLGNITRQSLDPKPLAQLARTRPQQVQLIKEFHEMVQQGLESVSVSLPTSGMVKPLESWKAVRHLPIDTPGKYETGKLDVTFRYLGVRTRDGRDEAVLGMNGVVRGKDDGISGKAHGRILVDLATGQTLLAETTVTLQLEAQLGDPGEAARKLRVLATILFRMQRKL